MNNKINVAYNWLGPRGPLWNTELPSIYQLASACENVNVNSHNYWIDDTWTKIFKIRRDQFQLSPTTYLEEDDVFVYPYSLSWRTSFSYYFLKDSGILEFSHMPGHIKHLIRNYKGYILIDVSGEAWITDDQLHIMHNYFKNFNQIPLGKIIYLTGAMNADQLYNDFCRRNNIDNSFHSRMKIINYPNYQDIQVNLVYNEQVPLLEYDVDSLPEKLFLCWNRRLRRHRTILALAMNKNQLIEKSFYSMGLTDPETESTHFENTVNIYSDPLLGLTNHDVKDFVNKLPLKLDDETWINEMCIDRNYKTRPFYQKSLLSLVTETNFDMPQVTLTEKSFKPIREKHPFIIVGSAGAIQSMRDLGFKTFNEFWDEGYDSMTNSQERMLKIIEILKDISTWSNEKILDFKKRVKHIVDHNYELLKIDPTLGVTQKVIDHVRSSS